MKANLHPKTQLATITCASCGTSWTVQSTKPSMRIDICSHCHPFYTGQQRIVDTAGQVDRFNRRVQAAQQRQNQRKGGQAQQAEQTQPAENA